MTTEEAVALLLGGQACEGCAAPLPGPGEPCSECGRIPPVTGPQLARDLSSPLVVAEVEAAQAEADGYVMLDAAIAKLHEADSARMMARLQLDRDIAQGNAATAKAAREALVNDPGLARARRVAREAKQRLEREQAERDEIALAEEVARRYEHGVRAEAEARKLLNEADAALGRYQRASDDAAAAAALLGARIDAARAQEARLKAELAAAQARLEAPGRIPYGARTISAGLMRLLMGGQLSDAEALLAGRLARQVCTATGALDAVMAQARAELLAEQEEAAKGRALHLRSTPDGMLATPNPHNTSVPQPFHPAQHAPHPVQPPAMPAGF